MARASAAACKLAGCAHPAPPPMRASATPAREFARSSQTRTLLFGNRPQSSLGPHLHAGRVSERASKRAEPARASPLGLPAPSPGDAAHDSASSGPRAACKIGVNEFPNILAPSGGRPAFASASSGPRAGVRKRPERAPGSPGTLRLVMRRAIPRRANFTRRAEAARKSFRTFLAKVACVHVSSELCGVQVGQLRASRAAPDARFSHSCTRFRSLVPDSHVASRKPAPKLARPTFARWVLAETAPKLARL